MSSFSSSRKWWKHRLGWISCLNRCFRRSMILISFCQHSDGAYPDRDRDHGTVHPRRLRSPTFESSMSNDWRRFRVRCLGSSWRSVPRAHGTMGPIQHAAAAANPTRGALSSGFGGRVFFGCLEQNGHNGRCDGFGSRVHRWLRLLDITDFDIIGVLAQ